MEYMGGLIFLLILGLGCQKNIYSKKKLYYLAEVPAQSTEGACEVCHKFPKVNFSK